MKLLLEHGANPNSRYIPNVEIPRATCPLIHIVAHISGIHSESRFQFMKDLVGKGADINGVDCIGTTFVEALYWGKMNVPPQEWDWILRHGGKITKSMIRTGDDGQHDNKSEAHSLETAFPTQQTAIELLDDCDTSTEDDTSIYREFQLSVRNTGTSRNELIRRSSKYPYSDPELYWHSLYRRGPAPKGLCDEDGRGHDAYAILKQQKFRKREYYTEDAMEIVKRYCPDWFPIADGI
ncbi:hypothetical protein F4859DRAFT_110995 [Xylaria cf. heliscus]|nr:hypothetical protein F4859DRAFT_110995 [Xylaria cf. heliscus]